VFCFAGMQGQAAAMLMVGLADLHFSFLTSDLDPLCARLLPCPTQNVRGSVGLPMPGTSLAVVDPDTLEPVPAGEAGLILARGPGVMQVGQGWLARVRLRHRGPRHRFAMSAK
jgi:acyl-CoA synthetase (AMP-forming)/AMP-acid ligase II